MTRLHHLKGSGSTANQTLKTPAQGRRGPTVPPREEKLGPEGLTQLHRSSRGSEELSSSALH